MIAPISDDLTVHEVLTRLRHESEQPSEPSEAITWSFKAGPFVFELPNFSWRARAIDRHDLHHLLIDQPFNLKGECQVATWEFAAGAYPDTRPRLFCLPLVAAGFVISPQQTWRTFKAGRRQQSLYGHSIDNRMRLGELRKYINDCGNKCKSSANDRMQFIGLLAASVGLTLVPVALAVAILR
jgi:hypothetical protein